jgi:hypothetical protein
MSTTTNAQSAEGSSPVFVAPESAPAVVVSSVESVVSAPVPPASPAPSFQELIAKADPAQLKTLALGKSVSAAPNAAPAATPATSAAKPEAPPSAPVAGEDPNAPLPDRFRFTADDDKMVALLAKREGISLIEAGRRIDTLRNPASATQPPAQAQATAAPVAQAPAPAPIAQEAARVSEIDADIAAKRAEVKKLRDDMEHDKADDLMVEIGALQGEKQILAAEARRSEQQTAQSHESAVMASRERAFTQFPELGDTTSSEHVGLIGYVTMEQAKPERQAFFQRADFPELIAKEFKQKFGAKGAANPAGNSPATPPASAVPASASASMAKPRVQQVQTGADGRLLTTAAGSTPTATMTKEEALAQIALLSPKKRLALMRGPQPIR